MQSTKNLLHHTRPQLFLVYSTGLILNMRAASFIKIFFSSGINPFLNRLVRVLPNLFSKQENPMTFFLEAIRRIVADRKEETVPRVMNPFFMSLTYADCLNVVFYLCSRLWFLLVCYDIKYSYLKDFLFATVKCFQIYLV